MPIHFFRPIDPSDIPATAQLEEDFNRFEQSEHVEGELKINKVYVTAYQKQVAYSQQNRSQILLWCHYDIKE